MYKLVIVEDEQDIRKRIAGMIEKSGCNFETIAEYENGIDAYDGIISESPDLILTDIRIPYIDGIELVKRVREVLPLVKIIIITGYSEFDYAKEAANLGVVGFVSKPVTLEDIKSHLKKAESALDEQYFTVSSKTQLEAFYENVLPIIKENDLYRLSNMREVSPVFENKLKYNDISIDFPYFVMCIFDFDESAEGNVERIDLAFSLVRKYVGEDLGDTYEYELFSRYEKLCLLIKSHSAPEIKEVELCVERIIQRVGRYSDTPLSAGISSVFSGSKDFAAMVREAMRALEFRSVMGGRKVFFFGNSNQLASKLSVDESMIKELSYTMRSATTQDCLDAIDSIRKSLGNSRDAHYYVMTGILNALLKSCDDLDGLYKRYDGPDNIYRRLFEIKTDEEKLEYIKEMTVVIRGLNDEVKVDSVERNLRKVTSYIEANYCDPDISFESLAAEVNFSVSYISALLKKKLNTSFVKLLTGLRMERAKELLSDPTLKIIDVVEQLGYNDSYYFSHCFKKYMGVSPKEFRSNEQTK